MGKDGRGLRGEEVWVEGMGEVGVEGKADGPGKRT